MKEPFKSLLTLACAVVAFVLSRVWPGAAYWVWGGFIGATALLFYLELRIPVNYSSLEVSAGMVQYVVHEQQVVFALAQVSTLEFVREEALFPDLDGPYIESKWMVQLMDQSVIEIMDEWPHRKLLLRAFKTHLSRFDAAAAQSGIKASGEGRWLCFDANASSASSA